MTDQLRGWGWVAHLRQGGTTPWSSWSGTAEPSGLFLPGAQQLETLRRLNLAGPVSAALAERVLEASAPGRGRPDLQLVGAAEASPFGPRPVDPEALPTDELIRVATSVLADDLVALGPPEPPAERVIRPAGRALARPWRRIYRLLGDPWLADPIRADLIRRGRPPSGPMPRVLVLGGPLDVLLAHTFAARAFETGVPPWGHWLGSLARRDDVAPRVDLVRVAREWARHVGRARVHIVTDLDRLPRLVGVRRIDRPASLPAAEIEMARRLAAVLSLLVPVEERAVLLRERLAPRLHARQAARRAAGLPAGPALTVPADRRAWLEERADRMRRDLAVAGYPVEGRLEDLVPTAPGPAPSQTGGSLDAAVLDLAIELLREGVGPT